MTNEHGSAGMSCAGPPRPSSWRRAAGPPAARGLPALERRRRVLRRGAHRIPGRASWTPAGRSRRTCTPSRRASTWSPAPGSSTRRTAPARVGPGDYGLLPVGVPHAWRNDARRAGPLGRDAGPGAAASGSTRTRCSSPPLPDREPSTVGRTGPAGAPVRQHHAAAHGRRQAEPGHARRVGQHAHGPARLRRHHREDDGRQRPRRPADARCSWCSTTRTGAAGPHDHPLEETYFILEGATEAYFDGETYRLEARRRRLGRRRLRARLPQRRRPAGALAGDAGAAAAEPPLVPLRPGLGLPSQALNPNGDDSADERSLVVIGGTSGIGREIAQRARGPRRDGGHLRARRRARPSAVAKELGGTRPRHRASTSPARPRWPSALAGIEARRPPRARGDRARHEHGGRLRRAAAPSTWSRSSSSATPRSCTRCCPG